jgi:lysophospholipase L1-like esterase
MNYLALGDSISIDDYTGMAGGGAVSQFARLIGADSLQNLTRDGRTTQGVLDALQFVTQTPDVVTLTAGGNDLLEMALGIGDLSGLPMSTVAEHAVAQSLENLRRIAERAASFGCPVIINTIYDPTDGDDTLAAQLQIPAEWRQVYDLLNAGIKTLAQSHGFLLSDLQTLFHGHGLASPEPWFVLDIEPNIAGATAIAQHWHGLYRQAL